MRVEANVSLRPRGTEPFGTRVEVKNMNSFRAVERAIAFEIERQAATLDAGETLVQETRGWSEERGETYRMRVKETSDDYRYFPEPDLPPLHLDAAWLAAPGGAAGAARRRAGRGTATSLGPEPVRRGRAGGRPGRDGAVRGDPGGRPGPRAKPVANWVTGEYLRLRNAADHPVRSSPAELAAIVRRSGRDDLPGPGPRGPRGACGVGRDRGGDHRRPRLPPDLGRKLAAKALRGAGGWPLGRAAGEAWGPPVRRADLRDDLSTAA